MVVLGDDVPTLRLVTLRGLVRATVPPIIIGVGTSVEFVRRTLAEMLGAIGVVVDPASVLVGTIALHELTGCASDAVIERVMSPTTAIVGPEQDIDAARTAMRAHETDRVIVVDHDGSLLGILRAGDLSRRRAA